MDKNCKIIIQRAANGFIVKMNDNGEPFVFTHEGQVVAWFQRIISTGTVEKADKKEVNC